MNVFDNEVVLEAVRGIAVFRDFLTGADRLQIRYTPADPNGALFAPQGSIASGPAGAWQNTDGASAWTLLGAGAGSSGFWYGSGRDGDATYTSVGVPVPRNLEFQTLVVDGNSTLVTPGWPTYLDLSATVSITVNGAFFCCAGNGGQDAIGFQGGQGGQNGGGSYPGYNGQDGTIGSPVPEGGNLVLTLGDDAAKTIQAGGSGGDGDGGAGGVGTLDGGSENRLFTSLRQFQSRFASIAVGGGRGGAGAGDGALLRGGGSGGGGGAGGAIVFRAPEITIALAFFDVSGGFGGGGMPGEGLDTGGGGGGAGGDAGIILFITESLTITDTNYLTNGGSGGGFGAGQGSGTDGQPGPAGRTGRIFWYKPSTNTWTVIV